MDWLARNILTILVMLPVAGGVVAVALRREKHVPRAVLATTLLTLCTSLLLFFAFDWRNGGTVQLIYSANALAVQYRVGIDGLSFPPVLLAALAFVIAAGASWKIADRRRAYSVGLLACETALLGTFLSLDFVLFTFFFLAALLATCYLLHGWGAARRRHAAAKLLLHALLSGVALVIVVVTVHRVTGSSDLIALPALLKAKVAAGALTVPATRKLFMLVTVAFLARMGAAPFHSWLGDAYESGTTGVCVALAATLVAAGGYGVLRVAYPLFPDAAVHAAIPLATLGVGGFIYAVLCGGAATEFKRLAAFWAVAQAGLVVFGVALLTPTAINGATFMMVGSGVTAALTVVVVGIAYDRAGHGVLSRLGGLATTTPTYWAYSAIALLANLGLPGLCGFVGEFLVLLGAFRAGREGSVLRHAGVPAGRLYALAVLACVGALLHAVYVVRTVQRVYFGPERPGHERLRDVNVREIAVLVPLVIFAILLGVLPLVFYFGYAQQVVAGLMKLFG